MNPAAVVALNRAVAIERVHGPAQALASIEPLSDDPKMGGYYLYLAVRGHLLIELGRRTEGIACFEQALQCRCSEPERRFLRRRIAQASLN